jgi:hypothetical protein
MVRLKRHSRVVMGTLATVAVFVWCLTTSARSDNDRWVESLHRGHRSAPFEDALEKLNASMTRGSRLNECSACHSDRAWIANLVLPRPQVSDNACRNCHQARPADAPDDLKVSSVGVQWLGKRTNRPAHMGTDFPGLVAGLRPSRKQIACAECHPDHEGEQLLDRRLSEQGNQPARRVKVEDTERYLMTKICSGCHLPQGSSPDATKILREFVKAHSTGDGFDPPLPKELQDEVAAASPDAPLDSALQGRVVKTVLETLDKQLLLGIDVDPSLRGCTPGCHGEHTPMTNDAEEYKLPESAAVPSRFAEFFARLPR